MEIKILPLEDTYQFLDVSVRIRADSHEVLRFLRSSYPRFRSNTAEANNELCVMVNKIEFPVRACIQALNHQYLVFKTTQGFVLSRKDFISGTVETVRFNNGRIHPMSPSEMSFAIDEEPSEEDQSHIFAFVQIVLLRTVATLMPHRHLLHAAAVTWKDTGVILPGATGHGKTTLTLALVKLGFNFLSDDIACLDLAINHLEPFPRSVNLRRSGHRTLSILFQLDGFNDKLTHLPLDMDKLFPNSLGRSCPLHYVFLLKGVIQSEPKLRPIPKRQALWQVLKLSHTPITNPREALWRLSPLFNQARCYELIVGELSATADLLHHVVQGHNND